VVFGVAPPSTHVNILDPKGLDIDYLERHQTAIERVAAALHDMVSLAAGTSEKESLKPLPPVQGVRILVVL